MIDKKVLTYKGKVVFEKFTRSKFKRVLRKNTMNEGCFVFLGEGEFSVRSQSELHKYDSENALLAKCVNYFYELDHEQWNKTDSFQITVVFIHQSIIEEIYNLDIIGKPANDSSIRKVKVDPLLLHFRDGINYLLDHPASVDDDLILFKLREFIQLILRKRESQSELNFFTSLFNPVEHDLKSTVDHNLFSNLTLDDFAELCNMSTSTFQRKFKAIYNDSLGNYMLRQKIRRASDLLVRSSRSISEIAYDCGFESISSLNRNFKKQTGMCPSNYRNQSKKLN